MMSFFYSSHGVMLPIFVRKVFGQTNFVANVGFLWLGYPVGSVLLTILVKTLLTTIHFKGFSVSISMCHIISIYTAYSIEKAHKKYLLKHADTTNDVELMSENSNRDESGTSPATTFSQETNTCEIEQSTNFYKTLRAVLKL